MSYRYYNHSERKGNSVRLVNGDTAFMIFNHLALHEDARLTLAELADAVGRPRPVALAALRSLVADGLVEADAKPAGTGRGRLFRVNQANPIYPELHQIAVKVLGGTELLRSAVQDNAAVEAAAIFGSVAAGTDRRSGNLSDIDLLIIFADSASRDERFHTRQAISEIATRLNREINVQAHSRSEWQDGKQTNRVLRRIAGGELIVLKGTV
ncbi:MAG: helix-turn-helix domain-containing protein [Candidatus Limnocylindrales bacterium]